MGTLMVFHIGPVQDFIAAARRSRDLWFGSKLLSELARTASLRLVELEKNNLDTLIFPAPSSLDELRLTDFNAPNKILAVVSQSPLAVAQQVENAIREQLRQLRDEAFGRIPGKFDRTTAEKQVDDMLEFYWVAVPYEEGRYAECRRQAEALMACRKNTREFQPVSWGSSAFKSSLDGQRESVIPNEACQKDDLTLYKLYRIRRGERLCGVGLLKRFGQLETGEDLFVSTSHISALPLLERLQDKDKPKVEELISKIKDMVGESFLARVPLRHRIFGEYDAEILYEERLLELVPAERADDAKKALREFLEAVFENRRPYPYYALLLADGDRMGATISVLDTPQEHRRFSQSLSQFATKVKRIVEEHSGWLIYAGGDDVLAMVPLHTVLQCAKRLENSFKELLQEFKVNEQSPTLSVGIAIVHHLEPLSDALDLVRAVEKRAKSVKGKNGLAITFSTRTGVERTIAGKWGEIDERMEFFIGLYHDDAIPDGAAYDLQELARTLKGMDDAIKAEAVRILKRKRAKGGTEEIPKQTQVKLRELIQQVGISQIARELIIAHELAGVRDLAGQFTQQGVC